MATATATKRYSRERPSDYFIRAITCHIRAATRSANDPSSPLRLSGDDRVTDLPAALRACGELYGGDAVTELILRSASQPAMLSTGGWAAELAATAVLDYVSTLAPVNAGADLINRGLKALLSGGYASVSIPTYPLAPAGISGGFVGEGQPISTRVLAFTATTITPHKLATIATLTGEMSRATNIEAILRQVLAEQMGLSLDGALFSNVAGDSTRPPGILNGVTGLTPTAGGGLTALSGDRKNLVDALTVAGGGRDYVYIASPAGAQSMEDLLPAGSKAPILRSAMVGKTTLIAVEAAAFASGFLPEVEFDVNTQTTIHSDTAAQPIASGGVVAYPVRNLFQQEQIGIKCIMRCSWAIRAPGMVQFVTGCTW
jgi:hypothetical protein